jgi:hypothetical protein
MKAELYRHAGTQGTMHPTSTGDLQKAAALIGVQVADQFDGSVNSVDPPECGLLT